MANKAKEDAKTSITAEQGENVNEATRKCCPADWDG